MRKVLSLLLLLAVAWGVTSATGQDTSPRWYKGNTHTHTLWSDGNAAPELVADWYVEHDYDFLVLSDHNVLSRGETWFPVGEGRLKPEHVAQLRERFGANWVVERKREETTEMRLKTLAELRQRFSKDGEFLFIEGEEITDSFENHPVHVNAINLVDRISPQGGATLRDTLQRNIDAVMEQSRRERKPMLAHINHPNFEWGLTVEDIASVSGDRFFEVYNGHSGVRNYGDETHPSCERMWDLAQCLRLREFELPLLFGLATDDSHDYFQWGVGKTNPGRGWVMVKAEELSADAIVRAMRRGDFYSSSGVTLDAIDYKINKSLSVTIAAEEGVTYTTQFIGTLYEGETLGDIGAVLFETQENPARYEFKGNELYVRAKVISSEDHPNPYAAGDKQCAWVQPVTRPQY